MKTKLSKKNINYIITTIIIGLLIGIYAEFVITLLIFLILLFEKKILPNITIKTSVILILIFLWSSISIMLNKYEFSKFFQQFILLGIISLSYSYILYICKNHYITLFRKYIDIMFIVSCLGLIQFIVFYIFNIDILFFNLNGTTAYDGGRLMRISSMLKEPGYLGSSL